MSSNLWATSGPIDLGIHLQRNKHGEQVVVAVDKGSPAAQEGGSCPKPGLTLPAACSAAESSAACRVLALCPLPPCDRHPVPGIDVGSVILDIDGVPISALSDDEVRDLAQHYENAKLRVTMRLPGSTTVQDRLVYFHRPSDAPSSPGLLGGMAGIFSSSVNAAAEVLTPGRLTPVTSSPGRQTPVTSTWSAEKGKEGPRDRAPPHDPNACFLGLEVTQQPPHAVVAIDDLVDRHLVSQGEPGYSNPVVGVGDRILAVGGCPAEHVPVQELHGLGVRVRI